MVGNLSLYTTFHLFLREPKSDRPVMDVLFCTFHLINGFFANHHASMIQTVSVNDELFESLIQFLNFLDE